MSTPDLLDQKLGEAQAQLSTLAEGLTKSEYIEFLKEMASWCQTMTRAAEDEQ